MSSSIFDKINQGTFGKPGDMIGAVGSHGGGGDPKTSSVPLLATLTPVFKDSKAGISMFDAPGLFNAQGTSGIGGLFNAKSWDKAFKAANSVGDTTPSLGSGGDIGPPGGWGSYVSASKGSGSRDLS